MDKRNWYYRERVLEASLDEIETFTETALRKARMDLDFFGVHSGLEVSQNSPPAMAVRVGLGYATDHEGNRVDVGGDQIVNCAVDHLGNPTAVTDPANERWLSIFLAHDQTLADPKIDGNGNTVYTHVYDGYSIYVAMGDEAGIGSAAKPGLSSTDVLLADVYLVNAQVQILTAEINPVGIGASVNRREDWVRLATHNMGDLAYGTPYEFAIAVLKAADIMWGGRTPFTFSEAWLGAWGPEGVTPPVTTLKESVNAIVHDLARNDGMPWAGAAGVGVSTITGSPEAYAAGNIQAALAAIYGHLNDRPERDQDEDITGDWTFQTLMFRSLYGGSLNDEMTWDALAKQDWTVSPWGHPGYGHNCLGLIWDAMRDICVLFRSGVDTRPQTCVLGSFGAPGVDKIAVIDGWAAAPLVSVEDVSLTGKVAIAMCSVGDKIAVMYRKTADGTVYVCLWEGSPLTQSFGWGPAGILVTIGGQTLLCDTTSANRIIWAKDGWLVLGTHAEATSSGRCLAGIDMTDLTRADWWIMPSDATPSATNFFTGGLASDGTNVRATFADADGGVKIGQVAGIIISSGAPLDAPLELGGGGTADWYVSYDIIFDGHIFWVATECVSGLPHLGHVSVIDGFGGGGAGIIHKGAYIMVRECDHAPHLCFDGMNLWVQDFGDDSGVYGVTSVPVGEFGTRSANADLPGYRQAYEAGHSTAESGRMVFDGAGIWCIPKFVATGGGTLYVFRIPNAAYRT